MVTILTKLSVLLSGRKRALRLSKIKSNRCFAFGLASSISFGVHRKLCEFHLAIIGNRFSRSWKRNQHTIQQNMKQTFFRIDERAITQNLWILKYVWKSINRTNKDRLLLQSNNYMTNNCLWLSANENKSVEYTANTHDWIDTFTFIQFSVMRSKCRLNILRERERKKTCAWSLLNSFETIKTSKDEGKMKCNACLCILIWFDDDGTFSKVFIHVLMVAANKPDCHHVAFALFLHSQYPIHLH